MKRKKNMNDLKPFTIFRVKTFLTVPILSGASHYLSWYSRCFSEDIYILNYGRHSYEHTNTPRIIIYIYIYIYIHTHTQDD